MLRIDLMGRSVGVCILGGWLAIVPAAAQGNLDAGKTPAQIFNDTCAACHKNPRALKQAGASFLREHYTTGSQEAAAMARYLAGVGTDPRAVQQRRTATEPESTNRTARQAAPGEREATLPGEGRRPGEQPRAAPGAASNHRPSTSPEGSKPTGAALSAQARLQENAAPPAPPLPEFEE